MKMACIDTSLKRTCEIKGGWTCLQSRWPMQQWPCCSWTRRQACCGRNTAFPWPTQTCEAACQRVGCDTRTAACGGRVGGSPAEFVARTVGGGGSGLIAGEWQWTMGKFVACTVEGGGMDMKQKSQQSCGKIRNVFIQWGCAKNNKTEKGSLLARNVAGIGQYSLQTNKLVTTAKDKKIKHTSSFIKP